MKPADLDLTELIHSQQLGLWRYLRFLGCDPTLAEDIMQDTFLAAYHHPPQKQDSKSISTYLRTIAHNRYRSQHRKQHRFVSLESIGPVNQLWASYVDDDQGSNYLHHLKDCFGKLGDKAQTALTLQYQNKERRADIAKILKMKVEGTKTLITRAKEALRKCIRTRIQHD